MSAHEGGETALSQAELAERARAANPSLISRVGDLFRLVVKRLPGVRRLVQTKRGRAIRHWLALRLDDRVHYTFTRFLRSPLQYRLLVDRVIPALRGDEPRGPLRIVVLGCSIGAEPYTISSVLQRYRHLDVRIDAYDIDPQVLARARAAGYSADEVGRAALSSADFVAATFETRAGAFLVRPEVAARVRFHVEDVLDPSMPRRVGRADIVYAQNLLMNLPRRQAGLAFENLLRVLADRSALFLDGVDLDIRERFTRRAGLVPVEEMLREIHEEAMQIRGERYPHHYSGLPPFEAGPGQGYRYATVFLREAST